MARLSNCKRAVASASSTGHAGAFPACLRSNEDRTDDSWKLLHKCPEHFVDFLAGDRFKHVFDDPGGAKRIKSLGWPGYAVYEFYAYYLWPETGKLFGIISASPHIEPRKGWMTCAFDTNHPHPETLNICHHSPATQIFHLPKILVH